MNVEELVRDSLRELAVEEASAGPGFADRVRAVRRRRRTRSLGSVAAATAAVVAVAVAVPMLNEGRDDVRPASVTQRDGISAHPDQSPGSPNRTPGPQSGSSGGSTGSRSARAIRTGPSSAAAARRTVAGRSGSPSRW